MQAGFPLRRGTRFAITGNVGRNAWVWADKKGHLQQLTWLVVYRQAHSA